MTRKIHLTKTINFGKKGEPSRVLVEKWLKNNGQNHLSELVRNLIVSHLSANPIFKDHKIEMAKQKIDELNKKRLDLAKELQNTHDLLNELNKE